MKCSEVNARNLDAGGLQGNHGSEDGSVQEISASEDEAAVGTTKLCL